MCMAGGCDGKQMDCSTTFPGRSDLDQLRKEILQRRKLPQKCSPFSVSVEIVFSSSKW